uniref:Uncharacterized protein n=1 Tax=Spongospora subterranea TaxID=70186 RepID=A0A0H5RDL6_9EUKA|eukprot:CRZ06647.1 hypothetical protein [Spongospora subterranea]
MTFLMNLPFPENRIQKIYVIKLTSRKRNIPVFLPKSGPRLFFQSPSFQRGIHIVHLDILQPLLLYSGIKMKLKLSEVSPIHKKTSYLSLTFFENGTDGKGATIFFSFASLVKVKGERKQERKVNSVTCSHSL